MPKKVVILDTGHNLTPNPTDVKILEKCKSEKFFKFYVVKITLLQKLQNITGTYLCIKVLYGLYVINMKQVPGGLGVRTLQKLMI